MLCICLLSLYLYVWLFLFVLISISFVFMIICFAALQLWSAHLAKGSTACNPQDASGRSEEIPIVPPPHSHKLYYVSMHCVMCNNVYIHVSYIQHKANMYQCIAWIVPPPHSHKLYSMHCVICIDVLQCNVTIMYYTSTYHIFNTT